MTVCLTGSALNAFSSVSLSPPTVLFCVATTSATHPRIDQSSHVTVNFLARDQAAVAQRFARSGGDKFAELDWREGTFGSPVIEGTSAHLEVRIDQRLLTHTHTIFIGEVLDAAAGGAHPLVYLGGKFYDSEGLQDAPARP